MVATNLHRFGVCVKFIQQNSAAREGHHNDEHLREDGECRRSECHEGPGNDVCNYRATREAPQHANDVEVFSGSSQQVSTLDIVTKDLAQGGIEPPDRWEPGKGKKK